jgi:hypothetical protein
LLVESSVWERIWLGAPQLQCLQAFCGDCRESIKAELAATDPEHKNTDVMKMMGKQWNELPAVKKEQYTIRHAKLLEQWKLETADYEEKLNKASKIGPYKATIGGGGGGVRLTKEEDPKV